MQNNHATYEIDPSYQETLRLQAAQLATTRELLTLPPLHAEQVERLRESLPPNGFRFITYLFNGNNNGARTDHIASSCAIGNASDCAAHARNRLKAMGLSLRCQQIKSLNRYGQKTTIGLWWLTIVDADLWGSAHPDLTTAVTTTVTTETTSAANDSTF
jgi:hypothetical protein